MRKSIERKQIGAMTAKGYAVHIRDMKKYFGSKNVGQISWQDVQAFIDKYRSKSRSGARQKRIVLGQAMQWAVGDGMIAINPARDSRVIIPQQARKRSPVPISEYVEMLNNAHLIKQPRDRALFALIAYTGMRRGEALALQWQAIDWKMGVIYIRRSVLFDGNRPVLKNPKSEAGIRAYPLIAPLRNILEPMRMDVGFIVSRDGFSPLSETGYTRAWERICKQVNPRNYTAHQFRHTVVGLLASSPDIAPKTTQTMAGHSDFATTMDIYAKTEISTILDAGKIFTEMIQKRLTS